MFVTFGHYQAKKDTTVLIFILVHVYIDGVQSFLFRDRSQRLECLVCDHVDRWSDCLGVEACLPDQEACFIEQEETTSGRVVYNAGCRSQKTCNQIECFDDVTKHTNRTVKFLGKRLLCHHCCHGDFCNMYGCVPPGGLNTPPRCLQCSSTTHPLDCAHVDFCKDDEKCISNPIYHAGGLRFTLGCEKITVCNAHKANNRKRVQHFGGEIGLGNTTCCDGHLCNRDFPVMTGLTNVSPYQNPPYVCPNRTDFTFDGLFNGSNVNVIKTTLPTTSNLVTSTTKPLASSIGFTSAGCPPFPTYCPENCRAIDSKSCLTCDFSSCKGSTSRDLQISTTEATSKDHPTDHTISGSTSFTSSITSNVKTTDSSSVFASSTPVAVFSTTGAIFNVTSTIPTSNLISSTPTIFPSLSKTATVSSTLGTTSDVTSTNSSVNFVSSTPETSSSTNPVTTSSTQPITSNIISKNPSSNLASSTSKGSVTSTTPSIPATRSTDSTSHFVSSTTVTPVDTFSTDSTSNFVSSTPATPFDTFSTDSTSNSVSSTPLTTIGTLSTDFPSTSNPSTTAAVSTNSRTSQNFSNTTTTQFPLSTTKSQFSGSTTATTTDRQTSSTMSVCIDATPECDRLNKTDNICSSKSHATALLCPAFCGICGPIPPACVDATPDCRTLDQKENICSNITHATYFLCPKYCAVCGGDPLGQIKSTTVH